VSVGSHRDYDPAAGGPLFRNFLDRVLRDQAVQLWLQVFFGHCDLARLAADDRRRGSEASPDIARLRGVRLLFDRAKEECAARQWAHQGIDRRRPARRRAIYGVTIARGSPIPAVACGNAVPARAVRPRRWSSPTGESGGSRLSGFGTPSRKADMFQSAAPGPIPG
jgi:hypothetical protein